MNKILKVSLVFLVVLCIGVAVNIFTTQKSNAIPLTYSDFTKKVEEDKIGSIKIDGDKITGITKQGSAFYTTSPNDQYFANTLIKKGISVDVKPAKSESMFWTILISWFPMFLLIGVWIFFMKKSSTGGSGGGMFSVGKNKAVMIDPATNKIKFSDVAGCDEAKEEVKEIVDFLKEPRKYENLGGKTPKGILLVGPPGTGKTLLARAIAGEAGVPFYSAAGSDFVEMFVGVGAARVRDMFEQAKKTAPCIIFIDEIDTIGGKRGGGVGGAANDERDSTLNQLLVAMDGFESNSGIIIIGATNRPETLDDALVRPGRLDRQIVVPLPDVKGREAILHTHIQTVPIDNSVDLKIIARGTPGFSGADLANLINEAAIMAAKDNLQLVSMKQIEKAKDKILMGSERKSMIMPENERINTAYHEAGHAIIALMVKDADPLYKVSIIPRSKSLGVTMQLPTEDKYSYTKSYMLNKLTVLFGGRCAEEIFMKDATTGASDDFKRATAMARGLVCTYGLSDLGVMVYQADRNYQGYEPISGETQREVDNEIKKILTEQYNLATKILTENKEKVELLARKLLEVETLDVSEINVLLGITAPPSLTGLVSDTINKEENNQPTEATNIVTN